MAEQYRLASETFPDKADAEMKPDENALNRAKTVLLQNEEEKKEVPEETQEVIKEVDEENYQQVKRKYASFV